MKRTAIGIPAVVIGLLILPMVVTHRSFGIDWTLHLWLLRQQQWNIEAMGHPGLFVSANRLGAFYPIFPFVGSGLYAVGGYLAIALGDQPVVAYKLLYLAGVCGAYGGMTWLSVQRGLRGWRSQVSGLVFVTGFYMVTDLATRGDMGEFMGLASIPFLLAATYAVVTSPRCRVRYLLAVVVSVFVFTGSHNITLLWGSTFIVMVGVLMLVAYGPQLRRPLPWRRVGALLASAAIGAGLNAWYLFPDAAYGLDTVIARRGRDTMPYIVPRFGFPLDPLRRGYPIRVVIPWMFVAWALCVAFASWRGTAAASKRLFLGVLGLGSGYVVLAVARSPWRLLPHPFYNIQFTRRLNAYVLLATALLVMLALERQVRARDLVKRTATVVLAVIVVFTVGLATRQAWTARSNIYVSGNYLPAPKGLNNIVVRSRTEIPPSWYSVGDFHDVSLPPVLHTADRRLIVPVTAVHDSKFAGVLDVPDGRAPFSTNISAGPRFVRMTGIRAVGRTKNGFVVAERARGTPAAGPVAVTIRETDSGVLRAGAIVSLLSAWALLAMIVWPLRRLLQPRRAAGRSVAATPDGA